MYKYLEAINFIANYYSDYGNNEKNLMNNYRL